VILSTPADKFEEHAVMEKHKAETLVLTGPGAALLQRYVGKPIATGMHWNRR
jgi:hypothetical protein